MNRLTRRDSLSRMGLAGACLFARPGSLFSAATSERVLALMESFKVPGLSLAIAEDGEFIRKEAFGQADLSSGEKLDTSHRFRIASVSKPITSAAVFMLIEEGKLSLDSPVFGDGGLLNRFKGPETILVRHLLTHTGGGWKNDDKDPMFRHPDWDHEKLIDWTLKNYPLESAPGKVYAYSNFGYCLLGRIVETVSGNSYESFVLENLLRPCGAGGMRIATDAKQENEVGYFTDGKPDRFKMNVKRMDSHGGWVGTPEEMVRFALAVDGFGKPADILKRDSLDTMTSRGGVNPNYACGWQVNKAGNWWHGGSLPGLSTLLVRTAGGYCWAVCTNTRTKGIGLALDRLMWELVRGK